MADLAPTRQNFRPPSGAQVQFKLSAANLEPFEAVWAINSTYVAKANAANANAASVVGLTVTRSYQDQHVGYISQGVVTVGANISTGHIYVLSPNGGNVCLESDLSTNHYTTVIGYGNNGSTLQLAINPTGFVRA